MERPVSTLQETILTPDKRPAVVASAVELVESEVKSKGGISGVAIKTGFKAVNAVKPTLVRDAVDNLLDRFVAQLEPFFADWEAKGRPWGSEVYTHFFGGRPCKSLVM